MNFNIKNRYYKYFDKYTTNKLNSESKPQNKDSNDIPFYAKVKPDTKIQVTFTQFKLVATALIITLQLNTLYKVLKPDFLLTTSDQLLTLVLLLYYLVFTLFLTYPPLKLYFNWLTIKVAPSLNGLILFQSWLSLNPRLVTLSWYNSNWALFWAFCNVHQAAFSITNWEFHSLHLNKMEYLMNLTFDLLYPIVPLLALDLTRFLPFDPPLIMPIIPTRNPSIPSILQLSCYQLFQLVLISIHLASFGSSGQVSLNSNTVP
ncbi:hypothetical protein CONCODRAFT_20612 [Conidiobolus coronatus NRRL 28638]|uniref:Uncharacterized protein n=1 Tax=Conidiobolus coronatus (strain ATCC 28846 / CBS 209.66 / NRRL 28638) TaxID=796925 RepID=A0A137NSI7_CONC2|nr:hypothetical protein CONCODRAFT_20612 [Conidiobolus coronatus NRRL 28638]|eukprot:KXN65681.1 hypothetical protein CONCODRAFT_20612 [Conidiobolus coronatus NRRL 28638]